MLCVVNQSSVVSNTDVQTMTRACASQLRLQAAPLWGLLPVPVVYHSGLDTVPPGAIVIGVMDDPDQAGVLGWHTEDDNGTQYGRVFAKPVLDNGGDALSRTLSVASVLSHEVLEWFVDPRVNGWWDNQNGTLYAAEVCDPVESDSYYVSVTHGSKPASRVSVSNFITPAWGDVSAPKSSLFDYLGKVHQPFDISAGGYVVMRRGESEIQKFGHLYPEWRKQMKVSELGRSARRAKVSE